MLFPTLALTRSSSTGLLSQLKIQHPESIEKKIYLNKINFALIKE